MVSTAYMLNQMQLQFGMLQITYWHAAVMCANLKGRHTGTVQPQLQLGLISP